METPPTPPGDESGSARASTDKPASRHSVYDPCNWAVAVPMMLLGNGTPATTAHHVLLVMATSADPDGTNIRVSMATLTKRSHFLKQRTTVDAVKRLEAAGLIVRTGELTGGTIVWKLNYAAAKGTAEAGEASRSRELSKQAERNRRYRQRVKEARDAALGRHVTPHEGDTNAALGRHVTPQVPSLSQVTPATPALDQPLTSPQDRKNGGTLPPDPLRTGIAALSRDDDTPTEPDCVAGDPTKPDLETHVPPRGRAFCEPHRLAAGTGPDGLPRCPLCRRDQMRVAS